MTTREQIDAQDKNGWRVPREGSLKYEIYKLMKRNPPPGMRVCPLAIAKYLDVDVKTVRVVMHYIRHSL